MIREWIREREDTATARELHRRLIALARYVGDRETRDEVKAEARRSEVLIGQLLGESLIGVGLQASSDQVSEDDRKRFRLMAAYEDTVERLLAIGRTGRDDIIGEIRNEQRRATRHAQTDAESPNVDLRVGDFREVLTDLHNIDAIITDPPYEKAAIPLYPDLAKYATTALSEDGVLAVMCGQLYLPEIFQALDGELPYRWTIAVTTTGPQPMIHAAKVAQQWKPVILYGSKSLLLMRTLIWSKDTSGPNHHKWGQGVEAFTELVELITRTGAHVVDPFLGAGATALACQATGRDFTGCDIDPEAVATTRRRLA